MTKLFLYTKLSLNIYLLNFMKYIYICIIILFQSNFVFAEDEITST